MQVVMAEDEGFSNKPFAGLAARRKARSREIAKQKRDHELFLAAIERIVPESPKPGGFALEVLCQAWPQSPTSGMSKRKQKKKKPETEKPQTPPAGQNAAPAEPVLPQATEEDEFLVAMRSVTPLEGKGRSIALKPAQKKSPVEEIRSFGESVEKSMEFALFSSDEYLEGHVVGLDELVINRLKEGHFSPEDHLDLHGLNAEQAWEALRVFIRQAWFKGLRCVLLVPGRGRNSPLGQGVLRGKLQTWLTQEPFKRVVLAFCTARPHDGGAGGVYALLRRSRKKGRIHWERLPSDADLYNF